MVQRVKKSAVRSAKPVKGAVGGSSPAHGLDAAKVRSLAANVRIKQSAVKPGPAKLTGRANAVTRGDGRKLGLIKQSVAPVQGFQRGKTPSGPFVPGAKLDASQITDMRGKPMGHPGMMKRKMP